VNELRTSIARGEYEADSRLVAEEIVAKLRLVRRARAALGMTADRDGSRGPRARSRRFRSAGGTQRWLRLRC
jgi:hypothetical protein